MAPPSSCATAGSNSHAATATDSAGDLAKRVPCKKQRQTALRIAVRNRLGGHAYFGLPSNHRALSGFYLAVRRLWYRSLMRRSQRRMTWESYNALLERFPLPTRSEERRGGKECR